MFFPDLSKILKKRRPGHFFKAHAPDCWDVSTAVGFHDTGAMVEGLRRAAYLTKSPQLAVLHVHLGQAVRLFCTLVIFYDASVHVWVAITRVSADKEGYTIAGRFREAQSLSNSDFLPQLSRVSSPTALGLAYLLTTWAVSQLPPCTISQC